MSYKTHYFELIIKVGRHSKDIKNKLVEFIENHPDCTSGDIYSILKNEVSIATVKRVLKELAAENLIIASGKTKSTKYKISEAYHLIYPIDMGPYFNTEMDKRKIHTQSIHSLIGETFSRNPIFTKEELTHLTSLQNEFQNKISKLSDKEKKKEFERLAIDLSWKSSQIEGNTYTLLETESLLKEQQTASGKTVDEATMLLNHKHTLDFIHAHPGYVKPLSIRCIEDIHSMLIKGLDIERNIRNRPVNITGTNYKPLENDFLIGEALTEMCRLVNREENIFSKGFLVLILISYIQPFHDGNKRTARIVSNAILMDHHNCPLSFRTVDPGDYKKAMLIFYEQHNISAFKRIFIDQCEFAVRTYF